MKGLSGLLLPAAAVLLLTTAVPAPAGAGGYGYGHGYGHSHHLFGHRHYYRPHFYPWHHHHHYGHRPHFGFSFGYVQTIVPPPVVVREYPSETVIYDPPAPPAGPGAPASCVMTREYQTEISVGGKLVPGYGTACLQPDGSWYRGPAVPEPY